MEKAAEIEAAFDCHRLVERLPEPAAIGERRQQGEFAAAEAFHGHLVAAAQHRQFDAARFAVEWLLPLGIGLVEGPDAVHRIGGSHEPAGRIERQAQARKRSR